MNKMIKMAAIAVGAAAMFAGCGAKTPDAVALDALKTCQAGKVTPEFLAKNFTTEMANNMSKDITMLNETMAARMKGETYTVVDTKINGDTAVVKIKAERGKENSTNDVSLILVDGVWKINKDH